MVTVLNLYLGSDRTLAQRIYDSLNRGEDNLEIESFPFGDGAALLAANRELGFSSLVTRVTGSPAAAQACFAFLVGRAEGPVSKNGMADWFRHSLLRVLFPGMPSLSCRRYLDHMDLLPEDRVRAVTLALGQRMAELGHLPTTIFFDPTNFSTEQDPRPDDADRQLAKCGNAKDKNFQAKLVGLAMATTDRQLPVFHEVYEGNENDARLFQEVVDDMVGMLEKLGAAVNDLVFVFDKGVDSKTGLAKLAKRKVHFLTSLKRVQAPDLIVKPASEWRKITETGGEEEIRGFRVKRTVMGQEGVIVATLNEGTRKKQRRDYERAKERFLARCQDVGEKASQPRRGRRSTQQSVSERIEDGLPKKWRGVFKYHVGATLNVGLPKFAVRGWVDEEKERNLREGFGKALIFTDRGDWTDQRIVETYLARSAMEEDMHIVKDVLLMPVMPIFHRRDRRIRVHVFLMVMGLLLYRWVQMRADEALGRHVPIGELARRLKRIRLALVTRPGQRKVRCVLEKMEAEERALLKGLKLEQFVPKAR